MLSKNNQYLIPIICIDDSTRIGAEIFDINHWILPESKNLIASSWSEYSVLYYCFGKLASLCKSPELYMRKHIETIQSQWNLKKFNLQKCVIYGEHPDLHIQIEAFFAGTKALLDLVVQLLSSQKIINGEVHGFHEKGKRLLNLLKKNVQPKNKNIAAKFHALIDENKKNWIDQTISVRDQLVHPAKGMQQLRFRLEFLEKRDKLECIQIHQPSINSEPIRQYAEKTLKNIEKFIIGFIDLLKAD